MSSFLKKKVAVLLSAVLSFSSFATLGVFAASELDGIISEVGYAYDYVDANDVGTITNAYARAINVTAADITDTGIDGLMTDTFVAKYDSSNAAKADLVSLIGKTLSMHYSTSTDGFETNAYSSEAGMAEVLGKIGVTVGDWADIMLKTRKDSQSLASGVEKVVWAFGSLNGQTDALDSLYTIMDNLQLKAIKNALEAGTYPNAKQAFETLGWTPEAILAAVESVAKVTDPVKATEFALIKAAARSGSELYVDGNLVNVGTSGKDWDKNVYRISPDELPITKTIQIKVIGDERATNAAGYYVSDEDMVTITRDRTNYELDVTINDADKKGEVEIVIKRDPYGDNSGSNDDWLLRQKVLIAYTIQSADKPVWGTDADAGKLSWTDVEHAEKYEVIIYKDGEEVAREEVTQAGFDANTIMAANGNGQYTAGVIAKGDIAEEVAAESAKSDPYVYSNALDAPNAPVWADKTLSWDAVTGATSYVVYLYRGSSTDPFETITVTDGTSYDATNVLDGLEGTFYAAVKAKNDVSTSAMSAKSQALVIENLYEISGKARLESYDVMKPALTVYQQDNSGITVTLTIGITQITTTTDSEGNYSFTDVPTGKHLIEFEHPTRPFLKKRTEVTVTNGDVTEDTMLYFGDYSDMMGVQINPLDISKLVSVLDDPAKYEAIYDVDLDGEINQNELTVLIRNYGNNPDSE